MSNIDYTWMSCRDPQAVKAFARAIIRQDVDHCKYWIDGDMSLSVKTLFGEPHDIIKAISKEFPYEVIKCHYSHEYDEYSEIHIVEYKNGEGYEVGIKISYSYDLRLSNDNDTQGILDKTKSYCRMLDKIEQDDDGKMTINWFPEEVCFKFQYEGENGKKYHVEAYKYHSRLNFVVS